MGNLLWYFLCMNHCKVGCLPSLLNARVHVRKVSFWEYFEFLRFYNVGIILHYIGYRHSSLSLKCVDEFVSEWKHVSLLVLLYLDIILGFTWMELPPHSVYIGSLLIRVYANIQFLETASWNVLFYEATFVIDHTK